MRPGIGQPIRGLSPEVRIAGETYALAPRLAATLALADLGLRVASLTEARDAIIRATEVLLTGL